MTAPCFHPDRPITLHCIAAHARMVPGLMLPVTSMRLRAASIHRPKALP